MRSGFDPCEDGCSVEINLPELRHPFNKVGERRNEPVRNFVCEA